jgi:arginyl-tRNA synthetase
VKKLLEATGWEVITDNHIGDSGTPFGIWVMGFEKGLADFEGDFGIDTLGRVYVEMRKQIKEEQATGQDTLMDGAKEWAKKLQDGDKTAQKYFDKFHKVSMQHIHDTMNRLGIYTDYELGESVFVEKGKELVDKYIIEGIFEKNKDGSVICRLDGFDVPMLMLKNDGAALYATTDLACMVYRTEEMNPDRVVHCVGAEQKFYFEQLFAVARKIGVPQENIHLWFGTIDQMVDGKREKMSSRKGVVTMEELLDSAEERVRAQGDLSESDVKKIALGAIKFTDFAADKKTGVLFDWDKIFAMSGYSGPFVQYAAVRANKIIEQNKDFMVADYSEYDFKDEKKLIMMLLEYPAVVGLAAEKLEAHRVANYLFGLAQEFNRYYENVNVSKAEEVEKSARLDVLSKLAQVFMHGLGLLGIEIPERM